MRRNILPIKSSQKKLRDMIHGRRKEQTLELGLSAKKLACSNTNRFLIEIDLN